MVRRFRPLIFGLLLCLFYHRFALARNTAQSPIATPAQVDSFRETQFAHRLRVPAALFKILQDEKFLNANPEYRPLANQLGNSIRTALNHDYEKHALGKTSPTIQTLASFKGNDYRSLPPDDPKVLHFKSELANLNKLDHDHWESSVKKRFTKDLQHRMTELIGALDYHDTYMTRKDEFGGENGNLKRKFDTGTDWIRDKSKTPELTGGQRHRMTKITQYMEQNVDYDDIKNRFTEENVKKEGFGNLAKDLISEGRAVDSQRAMNHGAASGVQAKSANDSIYPKQEPAKIVKVEKVKKTIAPVSAPRPASAVSRLNNGINVLMLAAGGYVYVTEPEYLSDFSKVGAFVLGTSSTTDCQAPGCGNFRRLCAGKNKSEEVCAKEEFFAKLPLNEQTELRRESDLDIILLNYAPKVIDISCDQNSEGKSIEARTVNRARETQLQKLDYDRNGEIVRASLSLEADRGAMSTQVFFASGRPSVLRYNERSYPRDGSQPFDQRYSLESKDWVSKKIYPHALFVKPESTRKIRQAQETSRLVSLQGQKLIECCASKACTKYFDDARTSGSKTKIQTGTSISASK